MSVCRGYDYREPYGGGGGYYGGYDQGRGAYEAYDDRYRYAYRGKAPLQD